MGLAPEPGTVDDGVTGPAATPSPAAEVDDHPDWWVFIGEQQWPFRLEEVTAPQARLVRQVTGQSRGFWIRDVIETGGTELDSWAVVCWMARMQNGEPNLTLDQVETGVKYGDDFGARAGVTKAEDADSPEA